MFANGFAPGTYSIAGADASPDTCGLCVMLWYYGPEGSTHPSVVLVHQADAGTISISSDAPPMTGSARNLHLLKTYSQIGGSSDCVNIDAISFATQ